MLVDARISLFVIYPGLPIGGNIMSPSAWESGVEIGDDDPFAGDVNFGVFVNETGGKLFFNRNDVDEEIDQSERMGAEYYTLTYQPESIDPDGKFRRIRVTLRDPDLHAVTKAGYYAPDEKAPIDQRQQKLMNLSEAVESTIPFRSLDVSVTDVVRYPDTGTAEFTVQLNVKNLTFQPTEDGRRAAKVTRAAASLDRYGNILASKTDTATVLITTPDPNGPPDGTSRSQLMIRVPRKTRRVRVVMENEDGGRIGSADLDRETIDAAPAAETPRPELHQRPKDKVIPAAPSAH